jgi:predicted Holliday junction resolvase-like endonuclease
MIKGLFFGLIIFGIIVVVYIIYSNNQVQRQSVTVQETSVESTKKDFELSPEVINRLNSVPPMTDYEREGMIEKIDTIIKDNQI